MTYIEFIVASSEDSREQPITEQPRKNNASKAYVQYYYLRHKGAYICQHCEKIYACRSSLTKHQGRSIKFYVERIKPIFDDNQHTPTEEFHPEKILAKMETIIPTK